MIEGLNPYSDYKPAGLPWLDAVPKHWDMAPNRALMRDRREQVGEQAPDYTLLSLTLRGIIARDMENPKGKFPAQFNTYKIVRPSDFVFCLFDIDETPRGVGLSGQRGMITGAYDVFSPTPRINPRFLYHYYLFVDEGKLMKPFYTGLRKTIQRGTFASLKAPLPPADEQLAIVRFLDHANRKIDGFIRAKRKLIALLNEQKQALIHRAVTRGLSGVASAKTGLDPNLSPEGSAKGGAKLKPSGIPWLGEIPEHWEVRRIKQVTKILRGKFTHRPRNDPSLYDGPYPFIQTGSVARAHKFITEYKQTLNERGLAVSKMFPKGTLCMTIAANIGDVAILDFEACFPDSVVGFIPRSSLDRDFLFFVFRCMKKELLADAPVNTQGNLNVERIGMKSIPFPSIEEQQEIAKNIEAETGTFDTAIARTEREIALMQEYRTRLTADIVTGKLDVREAAAKLPEVEDFAIDAADVSPDETEPENDEA